MDARGGWRVGNTIAPARFVLFCLVFVVGLAVAIPSLGPGPGTMAAFDAASALFLVSLLPLLRGTDADAMRIHAKANDANRAGLLALTGWVGSNAGLATISPAVHCGLFITTSIAPMRRFIRRRMRGGTAMRSAIRRSARIR